jgi:hypothetical protein
MFDRIMHLNWRLRYDGRQFFVGRQFIFLFFLSNSDLYDGDCLCLSGGLIVDGCEIGLDV